jgi:hypothetical protein
LQEKIVAVAFMRPEQTSPPSIPPLHTCGEGDRGRGIAYTNITFRASPHP